MTQRDNAFREIEEILARIDDEIATAEDRQRLNEMLSGDPEACEFYLDYMEFSALIEEEFGAVQPIEMQDEQRPENVLARTTHMILQKYPRVATTMWNNRGWAGAAAAVMLTASVAGFMLMAKNNRDDDNSPSLSGAPDSGLAVLRRTLDTEFSANGVQPVAGDILQEGQISLEHGVAQIELYDGARLLLEGPAKLSLIEEDEILLSRGRIRALVPPQSGNLIVHTGRVQVEANSSEFGLHVNASGSAEVHNFEGQVTVSGLTGAADQAVLPGLGMEVSKAGDPGPLDADSKKFLTWVDIVESSRANARRSYRDWRTRIGELSTDPRALLYYTFEDQEPGDHQLINHSASQSGSQNGVIVGAEWTEGRWSGKGALSFKKPSDRVRFSVDRGSESMTWVTWVKFDRLSPRQTALVHSETAEKGNPQWHITAEGALELAVARENGRFVKYTSPAFLKRSEVQNKWFQLVTVYHGDARTVVHYANGRELSRERMDDDMAVSLELNRLQLGNCNRSLHEKAESRPCHLTGTIDEILLFAEPLGSAEIRQMYEAGKP